MGSAFRASLRRELMIGFRNRGDIANPLIFFLSVIIFVPLGVSSDSAELAKLAPGMIWMVALLATLLSLDRLFESDFSDGSLEQTMLSGQSLYLMVVAKVLIHWLITGLPLTLLSPLLGLMLALPENAYSALLISLLLGSGTLSLIGSIGAALTVALRRGGLLLSLIIMPLYIPVLVFGAAAVNNAVNETVYIGQLTMLAGFLVLSLALAPLAAVGALKISIST
ncbi:MAG: heme exporter protein CcmB [Agarilytica sp.]